MSVVTAFFSLLTFFKLYTPKPSSVVKLNTEEYKRFNDIFTRYREEYTNEVIGFQNEAENLLAILCFLAAKKKGGVIVVSGELAKVKAKLAKLTMRVWDEIHDSDQLPQRTIDTASFRKESDSSLFINRIIKSGVLYLRQVNPRAKSIPSVFAELEQEIKGGKLLCIVEVNSQQNIGASLCGLTVSGWVDFTVADKEVVEHAIKRSWVVVSREKNIQAHLTDSELVRGLDTMLKDGTKEKLEDLMICLVRIKQNQQQEPPAKKLRTDQATTTVTTNFNNSSDCNNTGNSTVKSTGNSNTTSTSQSANESSVVGDHNGNTFVPTDQEVSVRDLQEDYTDDVPQVFLPVRAAKREISKTLKRPVRPVDQVTTIISSIPPAAADLIPNLTASRIVKTTLDAFNSKGKEQEGKRKRDEGT